VVPQLMQGEKDAIATFRDGEGVVHTKAVETFFQRWSKDGPYLLGAKCTHVDFLVLSVMLDMRTSDAELAEKYPKIKGCMDAVRARPQMAKYLVGDGKPFCQA